MLWLNMHAMNFVIKRATAATLNIYVLIQLFIRKQARNVEHLGTLQRYK